VIKPEHSDRLVSIITPTYNCAKYIGETIKSVQSQTYQDWEMLIVDDCSSDNTNEIVQQFSETDTRIKYICLSSNSGAAVARNHALKLAQGRWIAFLDSDDLWHSDKLEKQIAYMKKINASFSYTRYSEIREDGEHNNKIISGPKKIGRIRMLAYCWPGCLTVMYDRKKIGLIQIPPIKKNNDYALWLRISHKAPCFLFDKTLASYRKRSGSISSSSYISLIEWHYKLFREIENKSVFSAAILTINNIFWGIYKKLIYTHRL
jgi:Glycosyltransferases involved in cell wall biogenesis